jgi:hypothetical protein
MARKTVVAATITSHENVRTLGNRGRRTGVRSVARSRIKVRARGRHSRVHS